MPTDPKPREAEEEARSLARQILGLGPELLGFGECSEELQSAILDEASKLLAPLLEPLKGAEGLEENLRAAIERETDLGLRFEQQKAQVATLQRKRERMIVDLACARAGIVDLKHYLGEERAARQRVEEAARALLEQMRAYRSGWLGTSLGISIWRDRIGLPADVEALEAALSDEPGGKPVVQALEGCRCERADGMHEKKGQCFPVLRAPAPEAKEESE